MFRWPQTLECTFVVILKDWFCLTSFVFTVSSSQQTSVGRWFCNLSANWTFSLWCVLLINFGSLNWPWSTKILFQFVTCMRQFIGQSDIKHFMTSLIKTITSVQTHKKYVVFTYIFVGILGICIITDKKKIIITDKKIQDFLFLRKSIRNKKSYILYGYDFLCFINTVKSGL